MPGEKINVLFLMIQMQMGGAERLILSLARRLDRTCFAPSVGWFVQESPLKEFKELGIPLYFIPKRRRFDWSAVGRIRRIVKENRIGIINAHHFMPFFYAYLAAKAANGTKVVYTEHSESDVLSVTGKWRTAGRYLLRGCDASIGVSGRVSGAIQTHFRLRSGEVHTIENGVDLDLFAEDAGAKERLKERFGFPSKDIIVGIVANFRKNKNHIFLLKAFLEVSRNREDAKLLLIGQGFPGDPESSESEISEFIRERGLRNKVYVMGYRSDVHEILRMTDIFCLVSYKEGLPIGLIEAMASGLPVIGTNVEGIREMIAPNRNGFIVEPDHVDELAEALSLLIGNVELRRRMGEASRNIARERYSLGQCVDKTETLFRSLQVQRTER